jgi:hypothetical protein
MNYKLVGSRAQGTNRPDSDYDYMVGGIVGWTFQAFDREIIMTAPRPHPIWTGAVFTTPIETIREHIREQEGLPQDVEIDLFGIIKVVGCTDFNYGLCNLKQNFCLTIGDSPKECQRRLDNALEDFEY